MENSTCFQKGYTPWNKGKLVGQKRPLKLPEIRAIRTCLQLAGNAGLTGFRLVYIAPIIWIHSTPRYIAAQG